MKRLNTVIKVGAESTAQTELEAISKKRQEVIDAVKASLLTSLTDAAKHMTLLTQEGLSNVLQDPQYKEACGILGINVMPEQVKQPRMNGLATARRMRVTGGGNNRKPVSFEEAIQRSLADGKPRNVNEIYKRVQALKGNDASRDTMLAVLSVVRKKKLITNPSRGMWQKA